MVLVAQGSFPSLVHIGAGTGDVKIAFSDFNAPAGAVVFSLSNGDHTSAQIKVEASVFRSGVQLASSAIELRDSRFAGNVALETTSTTTIDVVDNVFRLPEFSPSLILGGADESTANVSNNVYLQRPGVCVGALILRGQIGTILRNNTFAAVQCTGAAVRSSTTQTNMGNAPSPGGNVFIETPQALSVEFGDVTAIGNTWGVDDPCQAIAVQPNTNAIVERGPCPR